MKDYTELLAKLQIEAPLRASDIIQLLATSSTARKCIETHENLTVTKRKGYVEFSRSNGYIVGAWTRRGKEVTKRAVYELHRREALARLPKREKQARGVVIPTARIKDLYALVGVEVK